MPFWISALWTGFIKPIIGWCFKNWKAVLLAVILGALALQTHRIKGLKADVDDAELARDLAVQDLKDEKKEGAARLAAVEREFAAKEARRKSHNETVTMIEGSHEKDDDDIAPGIIRRVGKRLYVRPLPADGR